MGPEDARATRGPVDDNHLGSETMTNLITTRFLESPLFAAIPPAAKYYLGLLLIVVLLVMSTFWAYRAWSDVHEQEEPASPDELMEAFEEARAAGELDEQEYARVRERLRTQGSESPPARRGKSAK